MSFCYVGLACLFFFNQLQSVLRNSPTRKLPPLRLNDLSWRIFFAVYELRIITLMTMCIWADMHRVWKGPSDDEGPVRAWRSLCTHLLAAVGGVHSVVQAGFVSQTEHFLKQVFAEVLEGWVEDKVAYLSVLLVAVMAEVDEVLDVVVGSNVLDVLTKTD